MAYGYMVIDGYLVWHMVIDGYYGIVDENMVIDGKGSTILQCDHIVLNRISQPSL